MAVTVKDFGYTSRGEKVQAYTIENSQGVRATVIDYGAALQSMLVKNAQGSFTDVVLGFDNISGYEEQRSYIGATIGRMANRVGGASFSLNGKSYELYKNDGENHLHGGKLGYDKLMWQASCGENCVCFSRLSPDGEEGYPGNLQLSVRYSLDEDNALHISYEALSDADTIVSLTNHSYFNLRGHGSVMDTLLKINAHSYSQLGAGTLPTGKQLPVQGSPFDFTVLKPIGRDISADHPQIAAGNGYDHNFILSGYEAAVAECAESGIRLRCFTQLPGVQLYVARNMDYAGKSTQPKPESTQAFCLETQLFPNAMNCYGFPSPVLHAGEKLQHETVYKFELI